MTENWDSIVSRYEEFESSALSISCVGEVARHIKETELSAGLFGWTSMHDLCITQSRVTYPYSGPYLRVRPLLEGKIEFRYVDTQVGKDQWCRIVKGSEAVGRLKRFLSELRWFSPI
jgi:hypothetical protein